jgi:hypothetical protein
MGDVGERTGPAAVRDGGAAGGAEEPVVSFHDRQREELGGYLERVAELGDHRL